MVAGEHPETVFPFVVDDVVHVADGAFRECVSHIPMSASIVGCVNVNFVTLRIVEVLSPEDVVTGSDGKVQGTGAAKQLVGYVKFCLSWRQSHDGAWHRSNQMP